MTGAVSAIGFAVLAGVMVTVQAQMLGVLGERFGSVAAGAITFIGGGLAGLIMLAVIRPDLAGWRQVPWWAWLGGLAGLTVVTGLAFAIPRIGITPVLTIVIGAQLVVALVLEQYGWMGAPERPIDAFRVLGVALVAVGSWLAIR